MGTRPPIEGRERIDGEDREGGSGPDRSQPAAGVFGFRGVGDRPEEFTSPYQIVRPSTARTPAGAGGREALPRLQILAELRHFPRSLIPLGVSFSIGNRSTIIPVVDAKHDVFLSMSQPRQVAYQQLDTWLDDYLGATSGVASQNG